MSDIADYYDLSRIRPEVQAKLRQAAKLLGISRRTLLKLASLAPAAKLVGIQMAHAEDREFRHALTLFKDIKYPPDFTHFDYVKPDAPKGGKISLIGPVPIDTELVSSVCGGMLLFSWYRLIASAALLPSRLIRSLRAQAGQGSIVWTALL